MYLQPQKALPEIQIIKLNQDIDNTNNAGKKVPPGVHAHLGYMYFLAGDLDSAEKHLAIERKLFPESEVFINRLLTQIDKIKDS